MPKLEVCQALTCPLIQGNSKDQDSARRILRSIIERMVIDPLLDSGILQAKYEPHKILGGEFRELSTFRITPFGKGFLEAINDGMKQEQP